jgi:hypothetical protein
MSRPPVRVVYEQPKRASVDMRYLWSIKGNWDIITARASYKFN